MVREKGARRTRMNLLRKPWAGDCVVELEDHQGNIQEIPDVIDAVVDAQVPRTPQIALLGYVRDIPDGGQNLAGMLLLLVKCRIAMCGGGRRVLRKIDWPCDVVYCH
ncbi:hypothetical protein NDU88_005538 [Pleurodeles waltl]|uniref:Uncharacterized protein n=1 Tax=Pleurodeles waltl TaxID=8319 RepID=A0AAV7UJJ9_PLEWA|nr:hypothetical protein NDU88_005538 [Pleurodeles waltl]